MLLRRRGNADARSEASKQPTRAQRSATGRRRAAQDRIRWAERDSGQLGNVPAHRGLLRWPIESAHSSVLSVANAMTCDGERKYGLIVRLKSRFGITWRAVITRAVPAS